MVGNAWDRNQGPTRSPTRMTASETLYIRTFASLSLISSAQVREINVFKSPSREKSLLASLTGASLWVWRQARGNRQTDKIAYHCQQSAANHVQDPMLASE